MVAVWKKNTLASLNARMSDEEGHSAPDKFRPVPRGNNTMSSCFVGNIRCSFVSEQLIDGRSELDARQMTRTYQLFYW